MWPDKSPVASTDSTVNYCHSVAQLTLNSPVLCRIGLFYSALCDSRRHFRCHKMAADGMQNSPAVAISGALLCKVEVLPVHCHNCLHLPEWLKQQRDQEGAKLGGEGRGMGAGSSRWI